MIVTVTKRKRWVLEEQILRVGFRVVAETASPQWRDAVAATTLRRKSMIKCAKQSPPGPSVSFPRFESLLTFFLLFSFSDIWFLKLLFFLLGLEIRLWLLFGDGVFRLKAPLSL